MYLYKLVEWLKEQDPEAVVRDGFGPSHEDRSGFHHIGFDPVAETTVGQMLIVAKAAMGATFTGWQGSDFMEFTANEYTPCHIGEYGTCGEEISSAHLKLWLLTSKEGAIKRFLKKLRKALEKFF